MGAPLPFERITAQHDAKHALLLCAAGGHNALMVGPPGEGKTTLAQSLLTILPKRAPFALVDPTTPTTAIIGGGRDAKPGLLAKAHNGALFLDELPQFDRATIEALRGPLESKRVTVSRVEHTQTYDCDCRLIAACNPCPCGWLGTAQCSCTDNQARRYLAKLSGPILDRIDLVCWVGQLTPQQRLGIGTTLEHTSAGLRLSVIKAQKAQHKRQGTLNASADHATLLRRFTKRAKHVIGQRMTQDRTISTRGFVRLVRVAATCADLRTDKLIRSQDVRTAAAFSSSPEKLLEARTNPQPVA